ncbi:uncharacterized protein LOC103910115 [Tachysurus ichikawai]
MFCSHENLERILQDIQSRQNSVYQHYQPILRNNATFPDIANRMDACAALTAEISDLVSKRLQTIDEDYNEVLVKERQAVCEEHKAQPSQDNVALAQAIADSLSTHRLPVPEPTIFAGDPLKFIDWKMSFMTLIDRKSLPPGEKMFYLKNYLVGEARKAVEGYFYRNSEDAYQGAWKVLQDRYGNPFILQRAFRDKLMRWPKIGGNDPLALRDFTDFLQGCVEAIPHVKGLAILNDCEENHKLLKKLPEWIIRKWNRIVVEKLDASGDYPSFKHFTEFMQKETRIACNPITSPVFMNLKNLDERFPKRAKALSTKADVKDFSSKRLETFSFKPKVTCFICEDEKHNIAQCPTFAERTIEDKKTFVQENHLCFGCLRKGHIFKDCKRRHKCGTCGRNHPTCLHEERDKLPLKASRKTSTEVQASQEVHKVMAHVLTQSSCATSSIVPVFISTVEEPQREVLTYALLDTQSDSSFILEDLLDDLNTITQPVQLRLSTMTAVDTITANDGLTSVRSVNEAKELIVDAQALCKRGGLRLHKFNSNEEDVLCCIDPSERDITSKPLDFNLEATPTGRVLGIQWSTKDDTFRFNINFKDQPSTRRGILSVIASLYDPIGFVSPFILRGKCILQELCRKGIGWDDQLPDELCSRWEDWKNGLQRLKEVAIPRCYHPNAFNKIIRTELHHFSDASNAGYGVCSYLRFKNDKNEVHCSLVMAKSRVAPTKITSIPRL